jgi:hypothetical protein
LTGLGANPQVIVIGTVLRHVWRTHPFHHAGFAADIRAETGIAWISVSVPRASHGSGRTACKHRAIPDFPELEPPLSTITRTVTAPRYTYNSRPRLTSTRPPDRSLGEKQAERRPGRIDHDAEMLLRLEVSQARASLDSPGDRGIEILDRDVQVRRDVLLAHLARPHRRGVLASYSKFSPRAALGMALEAPS